jgi:MFS family permease
LRPTVWAVLAASVLLSATAGIPVGFVAIKPILIDYKIGHYLCHDNHHNNTTASSIDNSTSRSNDDDDSYHEKFHDEKEADTDANACDAQTLWLNLTFIIAAGGVNALAIVIGVIVDYFGRRTAIRINSVLWVVSCFLFGVIEWCPPYLDLIVICLSSLGMMSAGAGIFLSCLTLADGGTKDGWFSAGLIISILTITWDVSASVYWVFSLLHKHAHLSLTAIFMGYSGIAGVPLLAFAFFVMPLSPRIQVKWPRTEFRSAVFWCASGFMASLVLHQYFYMATLEEETNWIDHETKSKTSRQTFVFSIFLFALAPLSLLLGWLGNMFNSEGSVVVLVALAAVFGALSCVPVDWLQYVTYSVFVPWRIFTFVAVSGYVMKTWDASVFGRLYGAILTIAGLTVFLSYAIDYIATKPLGGSYLWPNVALTSADLVTGAVFLVAMVLHRRRFGGGRSMDGKDGYEEAGSGREVSEATLPETSDTLSINI